MANAPTVSPTISSESTIILTSRPSSVAGFESASGESSSSSPSYCTEDLKKDERFYFSDGNILFLVDDTLFRVHRYFFERDSGHFRRLFSMDIDVELGAVPLQDVTVTDFALFLNILYPSRSNKYDVCTVDTVEEWTSILSVATRWSFSSIRALALRELYPVTSSIDKIALASRYNVPDWQVDAYVDVCLRCETLTLEEGQMLGMENVIQISQLRQTIRCSFVQPSREDAVNLIQRYLSPRHGEPEDNTSSKDMHPDEVPSANLDGVSQSRLESDDTSLFEPNDSEHHIASIMPRHDSTDEIIDPKPIQDTATITSSQMPEGSTSSNDNPALDGAEGPPTAANGNLSSSSSPVQLQGGGQAGDIGWQPNPDIVFCTNASNISSLPMQAHLCKSRCPPGYFSSVMVEDTVQDETALRSARPARCKCSWQVCGKCKSKNRLPSGPVWTLDSRVVCTTSGCSCQWQKCFVCKQGPKYCPYCTVIESYFRRYFAFIAC